jgi:geranylgeranyl pyrophosphate synthase
LEEPAIQAVLETLDQVSARQHAEEMALNYYRLAIQNLEDTGLDGEALHKLRALASSLLGRQT